MVRLNVLVECVCERRWHECRLSRFPIFEKKIWTCSSQVMFLFNIAIDTNDCLTNPCQHDGSCKDGINGYTCSCVAGYEGADCETGE